MTNREFAIKAINEAMEQADNDTLANILIEVMEYPDICEWCDDNVVPSCTGKCTEQIYSYTTWILRISSKRSLANNR